MNLLPDSDPHDADAPGVSAGYAANMNGVAAVDRAMAVVQALETARRPLSLAELARTTGLYKSAILRLAVSLERCGLVVRRADQSYTFGPLAFRLGKAYDAQAPLETTLRPLMDRLVRDGMESPSFHVPHDSATRLCLLRMDSLHSTLDRVRVGDLLPLAAGAPGKVLRQAPPDARLRDISPWLQLSFGERDPHCAAVAGPVFGPGHVLLGALSLSGPLDRFDAPSVRRLAPALLAACRDATATLGGQWPDAEGAPPVDGHAG
ncbi:helix-turn-helix domain-containing protein [uncultured Xylophilus sp.]|uniref:IclR family transcriptional regulator n=1 Tax=uncultured Xylophilus sp. TaxID=296832 RepID=UPI0025DA6965|nr:helix-turn-helix domain-containing protein [uncultured Xylophilus sp.]